MHASSSLSLAIASAEKRHSGHARQPYEADEARHAQRAHGMRRLVHVVQLQMPDHQRPLHVLREDGQEVDHIITLPKDADRQYDLIATIVLDCGYH